MTPEELAAMPAPTGPAHPQPAPAPTYTGPTPPVIGTRVRVLVADPDDSQRYVGAYETTVIGFDPFDGAVFVDGGEIVANHLGDEFSRFEVLP